MRISDFKIRTGEGKPGKNNLITDVAGVRAGHCTIDEGNVHTGVTVVIPCGNVYETKPVAAVHVINGFGKTAGLMQVEELGNLESPIALTNTLSVHAGLEGLVRWTLETNRNVRTFNPVCGETNDSRINDIASLSVESSHVLQAIGNASEIFERGAVGAGRGTVCFGLKGGIGSSSRVMDINGKTYTLGVLVQSNFGAMKDLTIGGDPVGKRIAEKLSGQEEEDKGSVMIILAADLPVDARQLKRILKRCETGLIRLGSRLGHGSGDVVIGFTTANTMGQTKGPILHEVLPEHLLEQPLRMAGEAVEEAVLDSLLSACAMKDLEGRTVHCLQEFLEA
jgi:D-aminopeptidase